MTPGKTEAQIEITPQMIEAGEIALVHLQASVPTSYLLAEVYRAMARAAAYECSCETMDQPSLGEKGAE